MHRIEPQTTLDGHTMPLAAPSDFARSMEQRSLSARSENVPNVRRGDPSPGMLTARMVTEAVKHAR